MRDKFLLLFIAIFSLGILVGWKVTIVRNNPSKTVSVATKSKVEFVINNKEILFWDRNPKSDSWFLGTVVYANYPKLQKYLQAFSQEDTSDDYLRVVSVGSPPDKQFFAVINTYHDHGGLGANYAMVYNPYNHGVMYETGGLFDKGRLKTIFVLDNGDLYMDFIFGYTDMCTSCGLDLSEYVSYDQKTGTYLTKNTQYKDQFTAILKRIDGMKCYADWNTGEELTFSQIKEKYGEDHECQFKDGEKYQDKLTPKKYFLVKQALKDVIGGKEVSILKLDL